MNKTKCKIMIYNKMKIKNNYKKMIKVFLVIRKLIKIIKWMIKIWLFN